MADDASKQQAIQAVNDLHQALVKRLEVNKEIGVALAKTATAGITGAQSPADLSRAVSQFVEASMCW